MLDNSAAAMIGNSVLNRVIGLRSALSMTWTPRIQPCILDRGREGGSVDWQGAWPAELRSCRLHSTSASSHVGDTGLETVQILNY